MALRRAIYNFPFRAPTVVTDHRFGGLLNILFSEARNGKQKILSGTWGLRHRS